MSAGKVAAAIIGGLFGLIAVGLIAAGAGLFWAYGVDRADDDFFTSPTVELSSDGHALISEDVDLGSRPGDWFPSGLLVTVRIDVESLTGQPVFLGIGPDDDVDGYLEGVALSEVTRITDDVDYREVEGAPPAAPPAEQGFWAVSAAGEGSQSIEWELEQGRWAVVIMNADGGPDVGVEASAGVQTDLVLLIAAGLLFGGLLVAAIAAVLLVFALRAPSGEVAVGERIPEGSYPVVVEGRLDPEMSRWLWLVKWLLVIPHYIVLAFLFFAFAILTMFAFFAILFTGRYPRSIFEFNVGVLRWSWRVGYYSYSVLGTDQYPPFTLQDVDYPARLDVAYPEELSRGLVLVKWWLLAIPHYLIVGLFTSGLVWWVNELDIEGEPILRVGGGLIGILVLIAAIAMLFTGRYPQGLYDLIVGLNRWVFRVAAYAALMRDEYPPFRLDTGGTDPATGPLGPDTGSGDGEVSEAKSAGAGG